MPPSHCRGETAEKAAGYVAVIFTNVSVPSVRRNAKERRSAFPVIAR
jgi:hypothetical protein